MKIQYIYKVKKHRSCGAVLGERNKTQKCKAHFVGTGGLLRFGHARVLTTHRVVIHCARAASLPRLSVLQKGGLLPPWSAELGYGCVGKSMFKLFLVYHGKLLSPHDARYRRTAWTVCEPPCDETSSKLKLNKNARGLRILFHGNKKRTPRFEGCIFYGSGTRIRTQTYRVRVCCATFTQFR